MIASVIPVGCVLMVLNHTAVLIHDEFLSRDSGEKELKQ
jgi:hypothetical protein